MAVVQTMAVVQRLVQNTRLSHTRFSGAGDSGRTLLTGGRCSEVAVSTALTAQRTPLNGITLGQPITDPINQMIEISK